MVAQSECLEFSQLMYEKLPKELRDLVYSYICLEDRQIPIGPYYHFRKYESSVERRMAYSDTQYCPRSGDLQTELADGKTRIDHDIYPEEDLILPKYHIFSSSYMGQDVALEMLKKYYQSNSFSVCSVEGGLDDLCTAISFGPEPSRSGFIPLDYIRDLQLRLKFEHYTKGISELEAYQGFQIEKIAKNESFLRGTVDSLRAFRIRILESPHELDLEVVLMTDLAKARGFGGAREHAEAYLTNFLQSIRNMVYELLHDCEHITVRVTHQDDGLMAFPKNYTGLFNLTNEQWQHETSRQLPGYDWAGDFWVFPVERQTLPECDQARLGGYYIDSLNEFLRSRWGVDDILHETVSAKPIVEGPYWPVGRPVDLSFAEQLHAKPTR
ncbi:uncharacterized protein M421DRAFT_269021 [Didymella exigua CBS 183.55]|uniref:Uncharacterized protein n=1 Tax=Didymella exigua CBS 183.55 TaxID=1150837 RepID=A0A6A5R9L9_9PLEO|nr:uncharacterized protein M421DRAFT_269021 [Didymella exigua CBS 183.55]KAF1924911.1 hypothetical protein M421DRAFT_269021 [Didymella exigua CBS 183.55]